MWYSGDLTKFVNNKSGMYRGMGGLADSTVNSIKNGNHHRELFFTFYRDVQVRSCGNTG